MSFNEELDKFKKFLFKNNFNFKNIKNFDSMEVIRFVLSFEKEFKFKLLNYNIREKKINFFLKKIKKNAEKIK
jgi:hypothetical protein